MSCGDVVYFTGGPTTVGELHEFTPMGVAWLCDGARVLPVFDAGGHCCSLFTRCFGGTENERSGLEIKGQHGRHRILLQGIGGRG